MPTKDYYAVLGVPATASADEVKKAYRQKARDFHPDRNAGDKAAEETFKDAQEAYETLSDAEKRKAYDLRRSGPKSFDDVFTGAGGRFRSTPDGAGYGRYEDDFGTQDENGDFFGRIFGGAFGSPPPRYNTPPRDTDATVALSFEDALAGGPRDYQIGGETVRLTIPKGVANGFKIRLKGRGPRTGGVQRGDLYVTFNVSDSPRFRREGDHLTGRRDHPGLRRHARHHPDRGHGLRQERAHHHSARHAARRAVAPARAGRAEGRRHPRRPVRRDRRLRPAPHAGAARTPGGRPQGDRRVTLRALLWRSSPLPCARVTFEFFLPDDLDGLRVLRRKGHTVYAVQLPRAAAAQAEGKHAALSGVGVYFLLRQVDGERLPRVYIGEAESVSARLRQHDSGKEFWTHAVAILDKDDFHKGQAKYLEVKAEAAARKAGRYLVENATTPAKAHLPEAQRAAADEAFTALSVLLDVLGAPLFTLYAPASAPLPAPDRPPTSC